MSTRALRKAQRELEEKRQQELLAAENEDEESEDDAAPQATTSLFAMLGADDENNDDEEEEQEEPEEDTKPSESEQASAPKVKSSNAKRKKKKKAKGGAKSSTGTPPTGQPAKSDMDEIDLALQSLKVANAKGSQAEATTSTIDPAVQEVQKLLSIDTASLHAANEMRRLFGRVALEGDNDDAQPAPRGGRRARAVQQGLAGAVAGRNMPGGQGLASLALRRNIFIQGKDEWPRATGGGLGMEIEEKRSDGTVLYKFVHNRSYQDVQSQFDSCVASMDPNRMVQLLQYNPYHISTLLQVSEIAKQERDHATSGDLLERALFSFGRAVHSSFSNNLSQGKARLDFRRPENREFWLAAWRYISNLGMRATWRTVYEWAKLLLSLDPENDPYCVRLVIDQFAVRGRRLQDFVDLATSKFFQGRWKQLPNIQMTLGLAYVKEGDAGKGQQQLFSSIIPYPWVAARLFQELEIDDVPPGVWGKQPPTPFAQLLTESYVLRAKDIWNTPEAKKLLIEVASAVSTGPADHGALEKHIDRDVARHILLTDNTALINLIPRSLTAQMESSSDPLPPEDNMPSYTTQS
ncbi:DUF654-domain-containing protein, partial [Saccharata proteae CBS 121410]